MTEPRIAIIVPCYNEETTIGKVVTDFHGVLPHAVVYVIDNNSADRTAETALRAGAMAASIGASRVTLLAAVPPSPMIFATTGAVGLFEKSTR